MGREKYSGTVLNRRSRETDWGAWAARKRAMRAWVKIAYCVYSTGRLLRLVATATATMIAAGRHITPNRIIGRTLDLPDRPRP